MASKTVTAAVKVSIEGKEYKAAMREINRENKEFKKQQKEAMKQAKLSAEEGFGGVIALAKKMAPAISAGAAALKVAQTALQENQRFTDEWARITESARASYESFVDSLVNADFTGFFTRIDDVVRAARAAADAMDALDTANIFSDKELAELDLMASRYRYTLRSKTASDEEKAAAREGLISVRDKQMGVAQTLNNANLTAFADMMVSRLTNKGADVSRSDFIELGPDGMLRIAKGSKYEKYMGTLQKYNEQYERYEGEKDWRGFISQIMTAGWKRERNMTDEEYKDLKAFMELSDEKIREALSLYTKGLNEQKKVWDLMASDSRYITAELSGGNTTGGGRAAAKVYSAGSIGEIEQRLQVAREEMNLATDDAAREVARKLVMALEEELSRAQTFRRASGIESIGNLPGLQGVGLKPLTLDPSVIRGKSGEVDANKDLAESGETAAEGIMLVSDTLQQLGIMSNIADEGLRTTMRVVGQFLGMIGGFIGGPVGQGISAVGSLVGSFSGGGIVGGTSYTGDRLTARVNSGEMILNATQQRSLFQMLNGGGSTGGGSSVVRGEDIYLALRNYGRRTGKIHLP